MRNFSTVSLLCGIYFPKKKTIV